MYEFRFSGGDVRVSVGDELVVEQGRRTRRVALNDIDGFVVDRLNLLSHHVLIAVRRPKQRFDVVRIDADLEQPEFEAFITDLANRRPDAFFPELATSEFLARYGSRGITARELFWVATLLLIIGFEWVMLPSLRHALDRGELRIDAGELRTTKRTTNNLVLTGFLAADHAYGLRGKLDNQSLYIPVRPTFPKDERVPVLLETPRLKGAAWEKLISSDEWPCVLRDLASEEFNSPVSNANASALSQEERDMLSGALICTLRTPENEHRDLLRFVGTNGCLLVLLASVAWVLRRWPRRGEAPPQARDA